MRRPFKVILLFLKNCIKIEYLPISTILLHFIGLMDAAGNPNQFLPPYLFHSFPQLNCCAPQRKKVLINLREKVNLVGREKQLAAGKYIHPSVREKDKSNSHGGEQFSRFLFLMGIFWCFHPPFPFFALAHTIFPSFIHFPSNSRPICSIEGKKKNRWELEGRRTNSIIPFGLFR